MKRDTTKQENRRLKIWTWQRLLGLSTLKILMFALLMIEEDMTVSTYRARQWVYKLLFYSLINFILKILALKCMF